MDLIFNRHRRKKGEDDIYLLDDMMSLILITYRHQDGMAGFNYIYVLWHLTMLNISIYCPPLLYYCIVDPCAEQDLWSVSSGVGRVASWARLQLWLRLRVLRGRRPDRSSEGGALTDTGHCEERSEGWHTGLGAWHLSTLTLWLRLLGGLDTGQGWTPPTITRAPHTGARVRGAHYESLGVSQSWRRECWSVGGLSQVMSLVSCEHSGDILMSNGHLTHVKTPFTEERIYRIKFCCWNVEE